MRRGAVRTMAFGVAVLAGCSTLDGLSGGDGVTPPAEAGTSDAADAQAEAVATCSLDLASDPLNCGACGKACARDEYCKNGACDCLPEYSRCDGTCVDLGSNGANCGACGSPVPVSYECVAGVPSGSSNCNGSTTLTTCYSFATPDAGIRPGCVDLQKDHDNCGACGRTCDANTICVRGVCQRYAPSLCTTCGTGCCDGVMSAASVCCPPIGTVNTRPICVAGDLPCP